MSTAAAPTPARTLFVTVGTTRFTALTHVMTDPRVLQHMVAHGITHLIVQYGQGPKPTISSAEHAPLHVECYDFKPSLQDDLLRADVLVCHAGAGTLTEALRLSSQQKNKCIVTVINSQLMDNHQTELAYALQRRGYVYVLDAPEAWLDEEEGRRVWQYIAAAWEGSVPKNNHASPASPPGDPYDVPRILYSVLGQEYRVPE